MQKILITGGTTFVSRFAAEYYANKGNEVYVINRNSKAQVNGVKLIDCNRTKLGNRLKGMHFDAVLDITAYTEEHVKTLLKALDSFDNYIFISSSAVYPETNINRLVKISPAAKIPYGATTEQTSLPLKNIFSKIFRLLISYVLPIFTACTKTFTVSRLSLTAQKKTVRFTFPKTEK